MPKIRSGGAATRDDVQREILPIPDRQEPVVTPLDARDAHFDPIRMLRPPEGAPNLVIVLIDDMGFGAPSAFGGPCQMPTLERLGKSGLKYNRFQTTALCSPSRMALLTGRNHHSVGMGSITEVATSAPGYTSVRPNSAAPIAEILRHNGYNTAHFGKCHEVPAWEVSPSGPFDRWPTYSGFEKFYGFIGGETNQWAPTLYDGVTRVEPPAEAPDYHFTTDITNQAIAWVKEQQALTPDKPFFMYFAPGACHAPHHVPKSWIEKYKGRFDQGWDKVREETLARQKQLGVVPRDAKLTPRAEGVQAWDSLSADEKAVFNRLMEVYAGFAEHTDREIGRLVEALEQLGVLEDTLFIYIAGDNGASAEGTLTGTLNELATLNGTPDSVDHIKAHLDDLGSPRAYNHYPVGWANAMCTPFQWTKQVASHYGGTQTGMVVHWPNGFRARGEIRSQWHHLIDIVPTILEAAGLPHPVMVNGVQQKPIEGTSMLYTFDDAKAADRRTTQYFEMFGNRGIYHEGWTAVTKHRTPWLLGQQEMPKFDEDRWELYDTRKDFSQVDDLAQKMPEKLESLKRLWLIEAAKYQVLPLDDRAAERANSDLAGRPDLMRGRTRMTLVPGMTQLSENTVPNVKNKSHQVVAEIEVLKNGPAEGVLVAQGGRFAGWSLFLDQGRPSYCYNWLDLEKYVVAAKEPLAPGKHILRYEFAFDGGRPGAGGTGRLYVDDKQVAEGRIDKTVPFFFAADETLDIGRDLASPVTDRYPERRNAFNGTLHSVQIDIGQDDLSHLEEPQHRLQRLLARH